MSNEYHPLNPWTGTNSGNKIDLIDPQLDQITINDIASSLSKICRFNGQIKHFYSVAEHSIYVASLVPERLKLQALLHDAAEAYICDIPTPLKVLLGNCYTDIEQGLEHAIGAKFGVELVSLDRLVKQADRIMVVTERNQLQDVPAKWPDEYENSLLYPSNISISPRSVDRVEREFLEKFEEYSKLQR